MAADYFSIFKPGRIDYHRHQDSYYRVVYETYHIRIEENQHIIAHEMVQQLQHASMAERIQVIEVLLQSLKHDIVYRTPPQTQKKPFRIRAFDLGSDISVDRED